ncbi:hypothetical protein FA10DRAFT_270190 [Acaromyces ingoldii]|uniref:Uncharacterized protein n=1 Tax=Acaromyces ingoldii TaxID=215250 RepID=A0A316YCV1_9BASI|nr:hypothetical protein FA10DRAFT_270190 [Acaromyces ingoldii]PWN86498.1 hypothetical protein FA10DRAFT_270190 [Acaromyces ingoldii]
MCAAWTFHRLLLHRPFLRVGVMQTAGTFVKNDVIRAIHCSAETATMLCDAILCVSAVEIRFQKYAMGLCVNLHKACSTLLLCCAASANGHCRPMDRQMMPRWIATMHRATIAAETFTDNGSTLLRQLQALCEHADVLSKLVHTDEVQQHQQQSCMHNGLPITGHSPVPWTISADQLLDLLGQDIDWWNLTPFAPTLSTASGDQVQLHNISSLG